MSGSTTGYVVPSDGIAVFNYEVWASIYPDLAALAQSAQAQHWFNVAGQYVSNAPNSIVPLVDCAGNPVRVVILGMVTAHLLKLLGPGTDDAVGRVASGTQGSVSVTLDLGPQTLSGAWWNQTKYGAAAWAMLRPYRSAMLFPAPNPYLGTGGFGSWAPGAGPSLQGTSYLGSNPWGNA